MSTPRKNLRTGIAALALAGTLGGGVWLASSANAQTTGTGTSTTAQAPTQRPDPFADTLKKLVDSGTITQAQADAVTSALKAAMPARGDHGPGGRGGIGDAEDQKVVADALGMTTADLETALQGGKTVAQVAQDKGVDVNTVIAKLVDSEKAEIQAKVASGEITQAQADQMTANLQQRVTDQFNGTKPTGGPAGGMHGHRGGPQGQSGQPGQPGTQASPSATPSA